MARKFMSLFFTVVFTFVFATSAFAQSTSPTSDDASSKTRGSGGPRRQLATILFAGLGGSILGLSTLSFYGRPQDKLSNIAIGFAVGVIAGTALVTYKAASNPRELYGDDFLPELEKMEQTAQLRKQAPAPLTASYTFAF